MATVLKCVDTRGRAWSALLWREDDRLLEIKELRLADLSLFISSIFASSSASTSLRSPSPGLACPTATLPLVFGTETAHLSEFIGHELLGPVGVGVTFRRR